MRLLCVGDRPRAASLRSPRRRAGQRVPGSGYAKRLSPVSRRSWSEHRSARRGRVSQGTATKQAGRLWISTAAVLLLIARGAAAQPATDDRILVVPFENASHEQRLHWLSEA